MIDTIISIFVTLGMGLVCAILIILNNIDEFIEWLEKRNKR